VLLPEDDEGAVGLSAPEVCGALATKARGMGGASLDKFGDNGPPLQPISVKSRWRQTTSMKLPVTQSMPISEAAPILVSKLKSSSGTISSSRSRTGHKYRGWGSRKNISHGAGNVVGKVEGRSDAGTMALDSISNFFCPNCLGFQ
jgi:hypothetical protein